MRSYVKCLDRLFFKNDVDGSTQPFATQPFGSKGNIPKVSKNKKAKNTETDSAKPRRAS